MPVPKKYRGDPKGGDDEMEKGQTVNTITRKEKRDLEILERIRRIVMKGDSVEIKGRTDGTIAIFVVKKSREPVYL